jgi:ribulose-phosphate 3-epimerase
MSPGLVINPGTPITTLRELTHTTDSVLIMTVNPGFGGQAFIETMLDKIRRTQYLLNETGSDAFIQVDGGISAETIHKVYQAGATNFIAGSAVFKHDQGIPAGIQALRDALQG